jgi:phage baseplate assembly protein V
MKLRDVVNIVAPVKRMVLNMVSRAVVDLVNDTGGIQLFQVKALAGEVREGIKHIGDYGFSSNPPKGAETVVLFLGGVRDHGFAFGSELAGARPRNLESGEAVVYNNAGCKILLKANGDVEITAANNVKFNGGSTPVAKEGSSLQGTAGPYPLSGAVASGAGSQKIKVP